MIKIRLKRTGRKKKPFYKIVLMKNLSRRDGKAISEIGYYDPLKKIINFKKISLYQSIMNGAYPSDTVRHLIYKIL
jgi:small subunit ribosomal protein S16